ncbi:MAG: deoxyribodipyrimidine photo-lyase [Calditrichia bacterium]
MFNKIFVLRHIAQKAGPVLDLFPDKSPVLVNSTDEIYQYISDAEDGKLSLFISEHKGNFVKSCPGTDKYYRCCQYYVINEMTHCPLNCSYCILQFYLDLPVITYFINIEDMLRELIELSQRFPKRILRIGTGELTDSLALDHVFHLNEKIIRQTQNKTNIVFEVKTKTNQIDHLMSAAFERMVFSWSVNPEEIIKREEKKTSSLKARLTAMKQVVPTTAKIGLHFDPIIRYHNWQEGYKKLIEQLGRTVPADKIAWISMGSFRHPADLKFEILKNHPETSLYQSEFITGKDGKKRYPRFARRELYQFIYQELRQTFGKDVFIYFCMESPDIWKDVIGRSPMDNTELDFWFAQSLYQRFPDMKLPVPQKEAYPEDW